MRIAIASRKGGVGKTVVSAGIASLLAAEGKRVVAIDLDPQSNLAFALGVDPTAVGTAVMLNGEQPEFLEVNENLHVIAGGPELAAQNIARLDPEDLADAIRDWDYDVFLFDCPPGSEHLERLGIIAADRALVVTNAHPMAIVGAQRVLEDLEIRKNKKRKGPKKWAIVANMIDARRGLDRHIEEMLGEQGDTPCFNVRQDIKISWAAAEGVAIAEYAPACNAARDLRKVMEWIRE